MLKGAAVRTVMLPLLLVVGACGPGSPSPTANHTAVPSATASPAATPAATPSSDHLVVMIGGSQPGDQTVSLVNTDGKVIASTSSPAADLEPVPLPNSFGKVIAELPEVSTSKTRVYFVSGLNELRYLGVDGSTGVAATIPDVKGRSQAVFAVSQDDRQIALAVFDWSQPPLKVTLSVEDLGGGHRVEIFNSTSVYEWPVAWHAGLLVVAVGSVFGGAPNPYAAVSYHVVNSTTGLRQAALGSTECQVIGPLADAGTACNSVCNGGDVHNPPSGAQVCLNAVDWTGRQHELYRYKDSSAIGTWAALSPDGNSLTAPADGIVRTNGAPLALPAADSPVTWWIDRDTVTLVGARLTGTNTAFYRLSTRQPTPVDDNLGWIVGTVPGIS